MLQIKQNILSFPPLGSANIPLIGGGFCVVSHCDLLWLSKYKWRLFTGKYKQYAYRRFFADGKTHTIKMHREIMNCPPDMETHHKNKNGLNNYRENLENLTPLDHRLIHGKTR